MKCMSCAMPASTGSKCCSRHATIDYTCEVLFCDRSESVGTFCDKHHKISRAMRYPYIRIVLKMLDICRNSVKDNLA